MGREDSGDAKKNTRDQLAVQTLFINLHPGFLLLKVMCFFANSPILIHNLGNLLVIYWFLSKLFHHVSPQIHQSDFPLGLWGSLPTWTHLPLGRPANNWKNCGSSPKTLGYQITFQLLPFGKHTKNYGKSPFRMGKLTISTGPFSSSQTVTNDQRVIWFILYTNVILHLRPDHSIQVLKKTCQPEG